MRLSIAAVVAGVTAVALGHEALTWYTVREPFMTTVTAVVSGETETYVTTRTSIFIGTKSPETAVPTTSSTDSYLHSNVDGLALVGYEMAKTTHELVTHIHSHAQSQSIDNSDIMPTEPVANVTGTYSVLTTPTPMTATITSMSDSVEGTATSRLPPLSYGGGYEYGSEDGSYSAADISTNSSTSTTTSSPFHTSLTSTPTSAYYTIQGTGTYNTSTAVIIESSATGVVTANFTAPPTSASVSATSSCNETTGVFTPLEVSSTADAIGSTATISVVIISANSTYAGGVGTTTSTCTKNSSSFSTVFGSSTADAVGFTTTSSVVATVASYTGTTTTTTCDENSSSFLTVVIGSSTADAVGFTTTSSVVATAATTSTYSEIGTFSTVTLGPLSLVTSAYSLSRSATPSSSSSTCTEEV